MTKKQQTLPPLQVKISEEQRPPFEDLKVLGNFQTYSEMVRYSISYTLKLLSYFKQGYSIYAINKKDPNYKIDITPWK